ncbi:MAG: DUF1203 domain-containing protein [Acidobacteria bacterium]|nr:DUF1203 domain-containing protein [Acidobacteriota bacterium]MBS1866415.1 DUF1203 domain-containing protein [Acidobacteriota bacterium]
MSSFLAVAIPTEMAESVRSTRKSPKYGFPAHREVAAGRAPCRHCLEIIRLHEEDLLLFTMDAFYGLDVPPSPGPVYIHAEPCARFSGKGGIPEGYRGRLLTLEAFAADRKLVAEVRVTDSQEEKIAEGMFANPAVEYVHVRSTEAGCFLFRLERN